MERGLSAAAKEMEFASAEVYARHLLASVWSKAQVETLARHLTIGETYFLRHSESLAVLENQVLPEVIAARRRHGRYLRIWCAGCCTGEEPYSIAIVLRRGSRRLERLEPHHSRHRYQPSLPRDRLHFPAHVLHDHKPGRLHHPSGIKSMVTFANRIWRATPTPPSSTAPTPWTSSSAAMS
jgi:hypothetical protein